MKIMLSAGEASGDLHGAKLAEAIKHACPEVELFGMGGTQMKEAGVEILQEIDDLGVIGLVGSLKLIRKLFRIRKTMLTELANRKADALVVIDYPEYNTRLARKAYQMGIPVIFYISPSAWAWRRGRAKDVAQISDRVASIFPFEAEVYREAGANVIEVGHPLVDITVPKRSLEEAKQFFKIDPEKKQILMMPGSRKQEIEKLLPPMVEAAKILFKSDSKLEFFLPLASTISESMIQEIADLKGLPIRIIRGDTYDLISICAAGMITSGTASLEAALLGVPAVIMYKASSLSYVIGKMLIKLPHFGLPNIVVGEEIVPELLQGEVTGERIASEISRWLYDEEARTQVLEKLAKMKKALGGGGAVQRTAELVLEIAGKGVT